MNASAPSATTPFSLHARHILLAAILCLTCSSVLAQTASADYTNDLPSVERVKAEIKGSDPTDTLARQVAVFTSIQTDWGIFLPLIGLGTVLLLSAVVVYLASDRS